MPVCIWGNFFIFALMIGLYIKDKSYQINTIV